MAPQGKCPDCGQMIGSPPGKPVPQHRPFQGMSACSGVGKPAKPL
jgi:hypothetical protein